MNFEEAIPAIGELTDAKLRRQVVDTWEAVSEQSPFGSPDRVVSSIHIPERDLLTHTNEVATMAQWMLDWSEQYFGTSPDRDVILAAAILHDIDKMVAFRRNEDGTLAYSDGWVQTRDHGPTGARIAQRCGVSDSISELIRLHSPFGEHEGLPGNVAGTIIHYADLGAADLGAVLVNRTPVHERSHLVPTPRRQHAC